MSQAFKYARRSRVKGKEIKDLYCEINASFLYIAESVGDRIED